MKEDYLWDKTGSDSEIEKLENALKAFRYQETAAPELPAKVVSFPIQRQQKAFRFAMAAAACIMLGVVSLGVWFQVLKSNIEPQEAVAEINQSPKDEALSETQAIAQPIPDQKPGDAVIEKTTASKQSGERKFVKAAKSVPVVARQKDVRVQASKQTKTAIKLTEEEKFAYDQLMLALSITSSKLKIVKDKVESADEKTAALENAR